MTYAFDVGAFSCLAILDAIPPYPLAMFLTNVARDEYQSWHRARGEDVDIVQLPYICLLITRGDQRALVDTGIGVADGGALIEHCRAAGVAPEAIDTVIISHGHGDHIGGLTNPDGTLVYPHARHVMLRREWDFWTSEPSLDDLPVDTIFKDKMRAGVRRHLRPLQGRIDLLKPGDEIVPGVTAVAAFGHSPGQMAVEIVSRGDRLLFVADGLILPFNFERPDAIGVTDHLPDEMVKTRRALLDRAAATQCVVATSHFPFPGLGRVSKHGARWQWHPLRRK